jgi:hypothetical protein
MNDSIYRNIRCCFDKDSKPALEVLLNRGEMLDVDLAHEVGMSLIDLRKALFVRLFCIQIAGDVVDIGSVPLCRWVNVEIKKFHLII